MLANTQQLDDEESLHVREPNGADGLNVEGAATEHGMSQLEWQDYEDLYNRWRAGGLSDDAVRTIGGANLLDLMEAQFILDVDAPSQDQGLSSELKVKKEMMDEK